MEYPTDNPFVHTPNAVPEIWATGFRNPHRISWDETGSDKMFITNIGQHSVEEVNLGQDGCPLWLAIPRRYLLV